MSIKSEHVKQWRKNMKQKVVISMGGKCQICNYTRCNDALELHHIDPNEKEFQLSKIMAHPVKWEKITKEAKKCILLCSNCHKEVHKGITNIPDQYQHFDESLLHTEEVRLIINAKEHTKITYCPICDKEKPNKNKYCSYSCAVKSQNHSQFDWGTIDLIDLIDNKKISKISIAKQLGCSDSAVGKRYRKLKSIENQ